MRGNAAALRACNDRTDGRPERNDTLFALAVFPPLLALYLVFAGQVGVTEVAAGVPASLLATLLAARVHRVGPRRLGADPRQAIRLLARIPASLATDLVRVGVALARGRSGRLTRVRFREGGPGPPDPGRRAMATIALSLAPNGIVVAIPSGEDAMVLHTLADAPAPTP